MNANECFERATVTSLGIAKSFVNDSKVNAFINGIWFATMLKIIFLTIGNSGQ